MISLRSMQRMRWSLSQLKESCSHYSSKTNARRAEFFGTKLSKRYTSSFLHLNSKRWLSTVQDVEETIAVVEKPIRILYGTQGGTAQLFAMQLADAIAVADPERKVSMSGLHESSSPAEHLDPNCLHIFLVSVSGVGEPPDNAREFYDWLMEASSSDCDWPSINYAVFGLGNDQAHPHHYNVIGINMDEKMNELGAKRIHEIGLGNDAGVIEDDFDIWMESLLWTLSGDTQGSSLEDQDDSKLTEAHSVVTEDGPLQSPRESTHAYQSFHLRPADSTAVRDDLFHLQDSEKPFYSEGTRKLPILANTPLSVSGGDYGLREMRLSIEDYPELSYETGDHVKIYPQNSDCVVDAYLEVLGLNPYMLVEANETASKPYPFPSGLTVRDTLMHCVDLGATPSPSFSRELLQKKDINYKEDIAFARRTVLELIHQSGRAPDLEELLLHLAPMKPRYYSIASSSLVHPRELYITYRPIKYMTNRGFVREGVCTSKLNTLGAAEDHDGHRPTLAASINSNPTFRLPQDKSTPVLLVAGGCGVAPIRAFLEERVTQSESNSFGEGLLFLGFRNPKDAVYKKLVSEAVDCGAVTSAHISYASGDPNNKCSLVSEMLHENGKAVFDAIQNRAYIYLCGGARSFGVAVENVLLRIFEEQGGMNEEEAVDFMRELSREGRLCEDLAD